MITQPALYHYTCQHSAPMIQSRGAILSLVRLTTPTDRIRLRLLNRTAAMAGQVVWATTLSDITPATRSSCGLTDHITACDRTEFRFAVDHGQEMEPWSDVRERWPAVVVTELELVDGVRPDTWWVAAGPVSVTLAPRAVTV